MPQTKFGDHTLYETAQPNAFHHICENLQVKWRGPRPRTTLCASLRSRNALGNCKRNVLGHCTRVTLCGNLKANGRRPRASQTRGAMRCRLCASLRSRNALGHLTRAILCGNLRTKGLPQELLSVDTWFGE